ncbi:MAG: DUF5407 family protein [Waddliaceae bacterium]
MSTFPSPNPNAGLFSNPTDAGFFEGSQFQEGFSVEELFKLVNHATISARVKLLEIQSQRSAISIGDMFEMQMLMNHLAQLSEMSTSVVSATHTAISSMARNVKG